MAAHAAVAIDDNFASGQAGITLRPADDKATRGVDQKFGVIVQQFRWKNFLDHFFDDVAANFGMFHVLGVLR